MKRTKSTVTKRAKKAVAKKSIANQAIAKTASRKTARKSAAKSTIRGAGWKRSIKIDEEKFQVISKAILASLTSTPIRFYDLVAKVEAKVKEFPGSVAWYTVSTLRELETQGKVIRAVGKPTTYQKG